MQIDQLRHEFQRSPEEKLILELVTISGEPLLAFQAYKNTCSWGNDWKPAGSELVIKADEIPALKEIIAVFERELTETQIN